MTATDTATAMLWRGGNEFEKVSIPFPELEDGQSLVRLTAATLCGSDRHTVAGRRSAPCPSILGHEGVGEIVTAGNSIGWDGNPLSNGDRVVFSVTSSCGSCPFCQRGLTAKCERVLKVGHEPIDGPWPLSGTYATHILLRAGQTTVTVPDALSDAQAATAGCAGGTVMAMVEKAGPLADRRVLVSGAGMLGIFAVAAVRSMGAAEITAVDPNQVNRDLALASGASRACTPEEVLGETDVALELSGRPSAVTNCIKALAIGGTAVLAGSVAPAGSVEVDPEWIVRGWRTMTGVHNYEPRHLAAAVDLLDEVASILPWDEILAGPVNLDELPDQFGRAPAQGLRTVLLP